MELLRCRLTFKNAATVAIEIDPRTFTTEMAEASESSRGVCSSRYGTSHLLSGFVGPATQSPLANHLFFFRLTC